jgi:hypothetical protein
MELVACCMVLCRCGPSRLMFTIVCAVNLTAAAISVAHVGLLIHLAVTIEYVQSPYRVPNVTYFLSYVPFSLSQAMVLRVGDVNTCSCRHTPLHPRHPILGDFLVPHVCGVWPRWCIESQKSPRHYPCWSAGTGASCNCERSCEHQHGHNNSCTWACTWGLCVLPSSTVRHDWRGHTSVRH